MAIKSLAVTAVGLLALAAVSCTGIIDSGGDRGGGAAPSGGPSNSMGGASPLGPGDAPLGSDCKGGVDVGFAPLARLTRVEYNNIVRDVLGETSAPAANFVGDDSLGLFEANTMGAVGDTQVQQYLSGAEAVAANVVKDRLPSLVPCAAGAADSACGAELVKTLGERLFRRPLEEREIAGLDALFATGFAAGGFAHGAELVLQALLQSPNYLYHVEVGVGTGDVVSLTPFEVATRLAFFLWESAPDAGLLQAAETGQLGTRADIEAQARRLLADERARAMNRRFYRQWMRIGELQRLIPDPQVVDSMLKEQDSFIDHVTWQEGGTLEALFTSTSAFLDTNTRAFYGLVDNAAPTGTSKQYQLDSSQRAGLLTRAAFLTANSNVASRGKFVLNQILCTAIPDPDPALNVVPIPPDQSKPEREQWGVHEANAACKGCHGLIDPIGFGFLHYDREGRYRSQDRSFAIDATGALSSGDVGVDGPYDGAVELSQRFGKSQGVAGCLADLWFSVALDRSIRKQDACSKQAIGSAFQASNRSIPEMMVALASSDAFTHRRVALPSP